MSRKQIENSLVLKQHGFDARTIRETPIRTIARRWQISVGEMLEVWGVDSLQEMLDTSPLQHPSQVVRINAGQRPRWRQGNRLEISLGARTREEPLHQDNDPPAQVQREIRPWRIIWGG